eukprot:2985091-Prymnesium_polylepis.1
MAPSTLTEATVCPHAGLHGRNGPASRLLWSMLRLLRLVQSSKTPSPILLAAAAATVVGAKLGRADAGQIDAGVQGTGTCRVVCGWQLARAACQRPRGPATDFGAVLLRARSSPTEASLQRARQGRAEGQNAGKDRDAAQQDSTETQFRVARKAAAERMMAEYGPQRGVKQKGGTPPAEVAGLVRSGPRRVLADEKARCCCGRPAIPQRWTSALHGRLPEHVGLSHRPAAPLGPARGLRTRRMCVRRTP